MNLYVFKTDGTTERVRVTQDESLNEMQRAVGGYIERYPVDYQGKRWDLFCHEMPPASTPVNPHAAMFRPMLNTLRGNFVLTALDRRYFRSILRQLAAIEGLKVCGSFCRGDYREDSDIDFLLPREARPRLSAIMKEWGLTGHNANHPGQYFIPCGFNHPMILRNLDFSPHWESANPTQPTLEIYGVTFSTW